MEDLPPETKDRGQANRAGVDTGQGNHAEVDAGQASHAEVDTGQARPIMQRWTQDIENTLDMRLQPIESLLGGP